MLGETHPDTFFTQFGLASLYRKQRRFDEAEVLALEVYRVYQTALGENHDHTKQVVNRLVELYEDWGRPEQAAEWRAKLPKETSSKR